ncbi:hypothetical protein E5D57_012032 [Metarhizium anisopliae]|nr:hypothetical protein E5D57_012032 [Metarhizium anisopliae]
MKFTAAILVLAAAVMAAPYDNPPPPKPNHTPGPAPGPAPGAGGDKCNNDQKQICCDKVLGLVCNLGLVNNCGGGKMYCCAANAPTTQNGGIHILDLNVGSCNRVF